MTWTIIFLIVVISSVSSESKTLEIFSSSAVMSGVVEYLNKMEFVTYLEDMVTSRRLWLTRLLNVIEQIESEECLINRNNFSVEFPTDSFMYIRQQAYVSHGINSFVKQMKTAPLSREELHQHMSYMPNVTDLEGSVTGLHRLEEFYNLNANDMAAGKIVNNNSRPLTTDEMFTIANYSFLKKPFLNLFDYTIITNWINIVYKQTLNVTTSLIVDKDVFYLRLRTLSKVGCFCSSELLSLLQKPYATRKLKLLRSQRCKNIPASTCSLLIKKTNKPLEMRNLERLCRGEDIGLNEDKHHIYQPPHELRCRLVDNGNPILLLQPVKVEEVRTRKPIVSKLYDILRENEIRFFKERALPELKRGVLLNHAGKITTSEIKISQQTFLPKDCYDSSIVNMRRRLAALTNFDIRGFEKIQVANYAGGGFYGPHIDANFNAAEKPEKYLGKTNRLVTMVMYISDVEMGGATVFPLNGAIVQPEKGGVALFYNLHRNARMNIMSKHSGCPIILGEKWIATQWVTNDYQELLYPCTLDEKE